jgi:hypothetical protein
LDNVDFTYPERPDAQVFNKLCLEIGAGKVLALVGPSNIAFIIVLYRAQFFSKVVAERVLLFRYWKDFTIQILEK